MRRPSTCRRRRRISPSSWKRRRAPDDERGVASAVRPQERDQDEFMTSFTRRKMLTGAAATAVGAVGSANLTTQTAAQTTAADDADRALFIALSAALTGIDKERLSPAVDPGQLNREYLSQRKNHQAVNGLMQH